jgi:phosphopantetheine--protein transferase-like protein
MIMKPYFYSSAEVKANQLVCYYFENIDLFDCRADFKDILSSRELEVYGSKLGESRLLYCSNKLLLRLALGSYMGLAPGLVEFDYKFAKPEVKSDIITDFNISHSARAMAIVITGSGKSGVDLEFIREIKYRQQIAARLFSDREQRMLVACEYNSKEFIRLWTMKEAAVKCAGHGMFKHASLYDLSSPELKFRKKSLAMQVFVHELPRAFISLAYTAKIDSVIYSSFNFKSENYKRELFGTT